MNATKIIVTVSVPNMFDGWGSAELEGIDTNASAENYANMLRTKLEAYYPEAMVTVETTNVGGAVKELYIETDSYQEEEDMQFFIDHIQTDIFNDDWYVTV